MDQTVVFNNASFAFVELEMKAAGILPYGTELENPDFAAVAEAMGIRGIRVEDPGEIDGALREAHAHDGPALVDVVANGEELPPPPITREQVGGFSLYLARPVLSGRADEVIDLARTDVFRLSRRSAASRRHGVRQSWTRGQWTSGGAGLGEEHDVGIEPRSRRARVAREDSGPHADGQLRASPSPAPRHVPHGVTPPAS